MVDQVVNGFTLTDIHCPVCGGDDYRLVGFRGGEAHPRQLGIRSRIVACRICQHLYPNPYPQPQDLEAVYGDPVEYFENHPSAEALASRSSTLALLARLHEARAASENDDVTLLDIGAGRGELVKLAQDRGWHATGVEPVRAFVDASQAAYGVSLTHGYFRAQDYTPQSFDIVVLSAVLEHVPDPRALISEIRTVLKPGGLLFLDIPNEASPAFKLANLYYRLRGRDWTVNLAPTFPPFHVQGFGRKSIKRLLDTTGYDIAFLRSYAGDVCDARPGFLPRIERLAFGLVAAISDRFSNGAYLEIVARRRADQNVLPA